VEGGENGCVELGGSDNEGGWERFGLKSEEEWSGKGLVGKG